MPIENKFQAVNRRKFLQATGGLTGAGLIAGCTGGGSDGGDGDGGGGGDGGDGGGGNGGDGGGGDGGGGDGGGGEEELITEFTIGSAPAETTTHAMGVAMSGVVAEHSDITLNVEPTSGTTGSVLRMLRGDLEGAQMALPEGVDAVQGAGRFEEAEINHAWGAMTSWMRLIFGIIVPAARDDLNYVSDLAGEPFCVAASESVGFYPTIKSAMLHAIPEDEMEERFVSFSEWGSEIAAGRLTAVLNLNVMGVLPGFIQQVHGTEDMKMLSWREETIQAIQDDPKGFGAYLSNDRPEFQEAGLEFVTEEETFQSLLPYILTGSDQLNARTVNELLTVLWNNREQLESAHVAFQEWQADEFFTSNFQADIPIHPGAAQFFQGQDMWNDDWQVADI